VLEYWSDGLKESEFSRKEPSAATPQPNLIVSRKGAKAAKGELVIST